MKDKDILAIGLEGSFGLGYKDKYSDANLIIVTSGKITLKEFTGKIRLLKLEIHPCPEIFKNLNMLPVKTKDMNVDLRLISINKLNNANNNYLKRCLKIVYDPKGILKKFRKQIPHNNNLESELKSIVYPLRIKKHIEICKKKKNLLALSSIINKSVEMLVKALFALNKKELISMKWALKEIQTFKKKPKSFEKRPNRILLLSNKKKELIKKQELIHDSGEELYSLIIKHHPKIREIKPILSGWTVDSLYL